MNDEQGGERLESWKKIAAYLRRDVRTVQRWEQTHGLPVHRHQRAHRAIPFAYTAELEAWWKRQSQAPESVESQHRLPRTRIAAVVALVVVAVSGILAWLYLHGGSAPAQSVAVLAFIDLSEGMAHEEFADGISEELTDRLSRDAGLHVPAPASSFYYKYKEVPIPQIGNALGVAHVMDGSVRKSGDRVRIVARLMRAEDASVVWSETYDRPWSDVLVIQDDVAGDITRAVREALARTD